ncbi:MAG: amidohydrolase family protein, partial [Candidatus Geothermincolia bacterium]
MARERSGSEHGPVKTRLVQGAALAGVAGAGYLAAKVHSVRSGLSEPKAPFQWKPDRGRTVLLKGANLVDVRRGQVLKERGVLYRDGQIVEVVATRDLGKATADRTFDCSGKFIIPGLINCHVHALMPGVALIDLPVILSVKRQAVRNMEESAIHGITTIRDASGVAGLLNEISEAIEGQDILGPRVIGCGPCLKPRGGYPEFTRKLPGFASDKWGDTCLYVTTPESARAAVRCAVDQGARFIKLFLDDRSLFYGAKPLPVIDDESVKAILDEAHRLGRRVTAHQSVMDGFHRAVRLGIDDFEHLPVDGILTASDVKAFMKGEHHITPTACVSMALGIAREGHPLGGEEMVMAMQSERERVVHEVQPVFAEDAVIRSNARMIEMYESGKAARGMGAKSMSDPERYIDSFNEHNPNIHTMYEAGATICCGNDGGTPLSWPGTLSVEMRMLEYLGMSTMDILRGATINAASLLDMENELGTIEPGKLADLVVLSADPTKDVRNVERVEAVFR